jgi:hypothetical protein
MALSILDGNQSATTLSTILSSGQHITAHTVVSLGTQAITDIVNATSANLTNTQLRASAVTVGGTVTVGNSLTIGSLPAISGTVTANLGNVAGTPLDNPPSHAVRIAWADEDTLRGAGVDNGGEPLPIQIYLGNSSVDNVTTANPLPISGTVTANLSISSTAITSGSFTSLTSATLVPANTARKMATVYNLGAGQLFINAGASATTLGGGFMVALNSGDFYECDYTTTTLSAIFATAGTASWMSH